MPWDCLVIISPSCWKLWQREDERARRRRVPDPMHRREHEIKKALPKERPIAVGSRRLFRRDLIHGHRLRAFARELLHPCHPLIELLVQSVQAVHGDDVVNRQLLKRTARVEEFFEAGHHFTSDLAMYASTTSGSYRMNRVPGSLM
jgi:hypothetical protein